MSRSVPTAFLLLLIIAANPTGLLALANGTASPADPAEWIDKYFLEWNRLDRPGGSVAVVRAGEVVFMNSYGLASLEHGVPNTDRTLYDIVSLAEVFTVTAIARLVAEGRLSFADDIHTLPGC